MLEFDFALSTHDYVAYNLYAVNSLPAGVKLFRRFRLWLVLLVAVAAFTLVVIALDKPVGGLITAVVGAVLAWLLAPWAWRRQARSNVLRMAQDDGLGIPGPHRLKVDHEGIREKGPSRDTAATWDNLERVAQTPEHLLIFTGAADAFIIPRTAGDDRIDELVELVRTHRPDLVSLAT